MGNPSPDNPKGEDAAAAATQNQSQQTYPPPPQPPSYAPPPPPYPNPYAPSPYQPHPQYPNPIPNPYPQPYDNYYYQQQQQHQQYHHHHDDFDDRAAVRFGRLLLVLMLSIICSMLIMSMIMWIFFGATVPDFEVGSISVSNFTATNSSLSGTWSVGMWVSNVNLKVDVNFQHGMTSIFYKNSLLGVAALEPFVVRKTQRFGLNYSVPAMRSLEDEKLQTWVLPTLMEDRKDGSVMFSIGMAVDANFTAPDSDYKPESLRILCEDLEVKFASSTSSEGTWSPAPGFGSPCLIRLHEVHD